MFSNIYRGKKILLTGHTGFKGTWLTTWLLHLGANVIGVSKDIPTNPSMFNILKLSDKIRNVILDIRNFKDISKVISDDKPDFVFHLAAQAIVSTSYTNPLETISSNTMGTTNVLEALRISNHQCTAIIITSDKAYDNVEQVWGYKENDQMGGKDIYSGSKGAAELIIKSYYHSFFKLRESNVCLAVARAGNVIGGGDWSKNRLIPDSIRSSIRNKTIVLRNPNFNRPWQFVLEPIKGYLILAKKQFKNPLKFSTAWNFGNKSKSVTTVSQIVEYIIDYWGSGKLKKLSKNKVYEQENLQLNSSKAMILLKWKPTYNVKQSVEVTTEWYYQVLKLKKKPSEVTDKQIEKYMHENKWY